MRAHPPGFFQSWLKKAHRSPWGETGDTHPLNIVLSYSLSFLLVALALLARQGLESRLGPMPPFIVFFPAILVVAVYAGRGPGILATLLSALTVGWYFSPNGSFAKTPINQIALLIFSVANIFLCILMERLRRIRWMEAVSITREQELEKLTRSELLLKASEERYRRLFEMESDTVLMLEWETGRFMEYNGAALRMYGYTKEEFSSIGHSDLSAEPAVTGLSIHNKETTVPLRLHRKKDGTVFPVEIACSYFEYQGHQVVVAAIRDITERVRSDERLVELNHKLYALNEHIQTVQERERIAIARDIHDDIGQSITVLKLDVEWILCKIPDAGLDVFERLHEMLLSVDQLTSKVQRIAADLRPPLLDQMGLVAAVEWQVAEFSKRSGLECFMMLNEDIDPLEEQLATTVMRIVQEALTNIARHSGATEVSVSLCKKDGNLILEISDNGCGIAPEQIRSAQAYGMIGMQERARICRGKLEIGGEAEGGTILQLTVPLGVLPRMPFSDDGHA